MKIQLSPLAVLILAHLAVLTGCSIVRTNEIKEMDGSDTEMKTSYQSEHIGKEELRYLWELRRCFEGQEIIEEAPVSILFEQRICSNKETAMSVDGSIGPGKWPSPLSNAEGMIAIWIDRHGQYWAHYSNQRELRQFWDANVIFDVERSRGTRGYSGYPSGVMIFYKTIDEQKQILAVLALKEWEQISWFSGWPKNAFITTESSSKLRTALEKRKMIVSDGVLKMEAPADE